ncbi:hypothetical protein [Rhodococcus sp. 66b]|uniref:hypothetical protein n=1 Tax=Rhodococcus sp. 66b TaxID=1945511 RepID=UPI0009BC479C|nr:hypothetical protein [Rhodococcus sp. 66b]OQM82052.1 hypothetical protein B0E55_01677 [Rhodococcus sp. 66b]
MSTLIETLAAHLPENHGEFEVGNWRCICGKEGWAEDDNDAEKTRQFASHVAKVISETHAIVELPKPHRAEEGELEDGDDPRVWRGYVTNYFVNEGQVVSDGAWIFTADGARQEAAALLAAANAAEVSS